MNDNDGFTGYKPRGMLLDEPIAYPKAKKMDDDPPCAGSGERSQGQDKRPDQPGDQALRSQRDQPDGAPSTKPQTCPPKQAVQPSDVFNPDATISRPLNKSGAPDALSLQFFARLGGLLPVRVKAQKADQMSHSW